MNKIIALSRLESSVFFSCVYMLFLSFFLSTSYSPFLIFFFFTLFFFFLDLDQFISVRVDSTVYSQHKALFIVVGHNCRPFATTAIAIAIFTSLEYQVHATKLNNKQQNKEYSNIFSNKSDKINKTSVNNEARSPRESYYKI